ncbi:MAG: hypothetical protein II273_00390 [Lachnospiraceae bacterium]|nr:hypothetical protein [Lachnospiraceae bacterium]
MLNEERIKLMTKMASYEANEGKRNVAIGSYFRGDYISLQVIKSIVSATVAFAICFALFVFYDFEALMSDIYKMDLMTLGRNILFSYVGFTAVYSLLSYVVFTRRYATAKKSLKMYYNNLKKLAYLYDKEEKNR